MVENGIWKWPKEWVSKYPRVVNIQVPNLMASVPDKVVWRNLENKVTPFSVNTAWKDIGIEAAKVTMFYFSVVFSKTFLDILCLWMASQGRLLTRDRKISWNPQCFVSNRKRYGSECRE